MEAAAALPRAQKSRRLSSRDRLGILSPLRRSENLFNAGLFPQPEIVPCMAERNKRSAGRPGI